MFSYIYVSIVAYALNAVSVLISKVLLTKTLKHPLSYVFYISATSLVVFLALPYLWIRHTPSPDVGTVILASLSTLTWTVGIYFMFTALRHGLADRVAPVIGTLTPIFLLLYYQFFDHSLTLNEVWAAIFMTVGLMVLILPYLEEKGTALDKKIRNKELLLEILAGFFFAVSYILLKMVYDRTDFLSGLVYSRVILIPLILVILLIPALKKIVFASGKEDEINIFSKAGVLFLVGQISGGASQFLISYGISLANPALVNSLQGVQYAFLFIASLILAKKLPKIFPENFGYRRILQNILGIAFIALGLYILAYANQTANNATVGVTYSPRYAQSLGLNPKITFIQMMDDLNPKTIRLPIYWDQLEETQGKYDFSATDYYVHQAEQRHVKLTFVIGYKVPRFPECYIPSWADNISSESFNKALYNEIGAVVAHYKNSPAMDVWQVENEPLFPFGVCPPVSLNRLQQEIAVVHQMDPKHPVMVTDSGEFGLWVNVAKNADIVGTTLYRRTLAPYVPWFKTPLPPFFYQLKGMLVHLLYPNKKIYVSELQEEPWSNGPLIDEPLNVQTSSLPLEDLGDNIIFSRQAGFDTVYAWGVEWWYYLKTQGHPEYLNKAIMIFNDIK